MSHRWRLLFLAMVAVVCFPPVARADSAAVTSGAVSVYWDGSLGGIELRGAGTHLIAEEMQSAPQGFQAGQIANLSATVGTATMNHPVSATVNGTTYPSVWVKGQFAFMAMPFTVPSEPVGSEQFFSTPVTMTGQFYGYSDQAMTDQVFAVSLSGSGVATIGPMRVVAPDTYIMREGGVGYRLTSAVPAPWSSASVGTVGQAGVASFDGSTFFISGSGSDIWGGADSFQFVSRALDGDGEIVARVDAISDTDTFAKAGIMLRTSLSPDAADVILDLRPTGDIEFMTRGTNGGLTSYLGGAVHLAPVWLRLTRTGSTVTAAVSADGSSWMAVGSTPFPVGPSLAGLAVTSHDNSALNTSTFDEVTVAAAAPSGASDVVIYANDIPASALHGAWTKAVDGTAAAGVALITPDNGVSNIPQALASPDHYVDVTFTAAANTPYTIWLRLQAAGNSKWNDSVWVQFSDAKAAGTGVYAIDSTSALLVNLATDSSATSLNGWGWQNGAYWLAQPTTVTFSDSPTHTLRIQVREDGVRFDQIVLSPVTFAGAAPGPLGGDHTIVPR